MSLFIPAGSRVTRESGEYIATLSVDLTGTTKLSASVFTDVQIKGIEDGALMPTDRVGKQWWRPRPRGGIQLHIHGRGWV